MPEKKVAESHRSIDYDKEAQTYDRLRMGNREMVEQILSRSELRVGSLVLDIGCGTANNTLMLASSIHGNVVGLDLSLGMLRTACLKTRVVPVVQADSAIMPFREGSFDFAYAIEVVHHLSNYRETLSEAHRVLGTEASLCIVTQSHSQITERTTSRFFPSTVRIDQQRYPKITEIEDTLKQVGFVDVQTDRHSFAPVRLGEDYVRTVEQKGYSMLHKVSEEEYSRGIDQLKSTLAQGEVLQYSAGYTFVTARRES